MPQIIFNTISAAEISQLPTMEQLELLAEFEVKPTDLENPDGEKFGTLERDGAALYRYRADKHRIYFAVEGDDIIVHRVLDADTFGDFLFRTKLGGSKEDSDLSACPQFWELIDEGANAERA